MERTEFWNALDSICSKLKRLEAKISSNVVDKKELQRCSDELEILLEDLVFHVTAEFPVSEEEGYREADASKLIDLANSISEGFMSYVTSAKAGLDDPADYETFTSHKKKLDTDLSLLSDYGLDTEQEKEDGSAAPAKKLPPVPVKAKPPRESDGIVIPRVSRSSHGSSRISSARTSAAAVLEEDAPRSPKTGTSASLRNMSDSSVRVASQRNTWKSPKPPSRVTSMISAHSTVSIHSNHTNNAISSSASSIPVVEPKVVVSARFYHCISYDRPHQRVLIHGGLRRDKPSNFCNGNVFCLDLSEMKSSSDTQSYVWRSFETTGQVAPSMCWHASVMLDHNRFMIFGGKSTNQSMSSSCYVLDVKSRMWSSVPPSGSVPGPRGGHSLLRMPDGDTFVLFGGMDGAGVSCYNDVFLFNRDTMSWTAQPTTNSPVGRFLHAATVMQQKMWIFGGFRGSLSKSSHCGDLWCLDLVTWEWCQPKQTGNPPEPGTYVLVPLDGESGTEICCIGSKGFDESRDTFFVLSTPECGPEGEWDKTVIWSKGTYPKQYRPTVSEGHSASVIARSVYIIGGRPGNSQDSSIDFNIIPKSVFFECVSKHKKKHSSAKKRLSQSSNLLKKVDHGRSQTVGLRGKDRKAIDEATFQGDISPLGGSGAIISKEASRIQVMDEVKRELGEATGKVSELSAENAELKEKLANLQHNFELELSLRLDVESKVQEETNKARVFRAAFEQLQVETARLYQLAMSEVNTTSGKEKLHRRYEELRDASDIAAYKKMSREQSDKFTTISRSAKKKGDKDELLDQHLQMVNKVNAEANKLLETFKKKIEPPVSSIDDVAVVFDNVPKKEEEPKKKDIGPIPKTLREIWGSPELSNEFALFVQQTNMSNHGNVLFCVNVHRMMQVEEGMKHALIESLILEHVVAEADHPVNILSDMEREDLVECSNTTWLQELPDNEFWTDLLEQVEDGLLSIFSEYRDALNSGVDNIRARYSVLSRRHGTVGQHQLVATAETQLMERLAEMEKEDSEDKTDNSEQDEFLFKKVSSEMVATEINFTTDCKILTTVFRRPLMGEKSPILPLETFNIFANIEDVYSLNKKFLTALQREHGKPLISKNYGKVFLEFAPQFQKVYLAYASRKTTSRNTIDQLVATNKKFVAFLEECLQKPSTRRLELKSFLIKPVQRICKYPLLLRTMVESCPSSYSDKESLVEAKKRMEEVVHALEEQLFVEDDKMKVLEREGALNWHRDPKLVLVTEGRDWVHDGYLFGSEIQGGANISEAMKNMRNFHVHLFSDILLVVEEMEKKGTRREYLRHVVGIPYSVVIPVPGKPSFQIVQAQQDFRYLFRCSDQKVKKYWVQILGDTIAEARRKLDLTSATTTVESAIRPVSK